ncbi:MAG TPA: hypothetical protein VGB84_04035 [Arachidicoccus sp.]
MKKNIFQLLLFACAANFSVAQNKTKIHVQGLKEPTDTLQQENYEGTLKYIIQISDHLNPRKYNYKLDSKTYKLLDKTFISGSFQYNFVAESDIKTL